MSVVAFSPARFTPADLSAFNEIAHLRLAQGLWVDVSRQTTRDSDQILVRFPRIDRHVFCFERNRTGTYALWFQDRDGWHNISSGTSVADSLHVWLPHGRSA